MSGLSQDTLDLLDLLAKHAVEFVICGGHAVAFHGYVRMTVDIDVLVRPDAQNAKRLMAALADFGFGDAGIPESAFWQRGTAVSLGVAPNQVDLLTSMSSQDVETVFANAQAGVLGGRTVRFVSLGDLLQAKREAGRPKDLVDAFELEALRQHRE